MRLKIRPEAMGSGLREVLRKGEVGERPEAWAVDVKCMRKGEVGEKPEAPWASWM